MAHIISAGEVKFLPKLEEKYYLEPLNDETRQALEAETLPENKFIGKLCADMKPHNLYKLPLERIRYIGKSKIGSGYLDFHVWFQRGYGMIGRWRLLEPSVRKKALAARMVRKGCKSENRSR